MGSKLENCIVCDGYLFSPYCTDVIQCDGCSLVVADEIPTAAEVEKLYQKEYFFGMEYSDYEADRPALEFNFKRRARSLKRMLRPDYDVVEVGCAYGYFLNIIKPKVRSHIGFDVSEDGIRFAKDQLGVNATNDDFLKYNFKKNSIDSVFMWDVAEHLTEPDKYFKKVSSILKPGGRLSLTTGNIDALLPRVRKGNWRMIHPPTHVYYFNPETIGRLLKKHGLIVEKVRHRSSSRNVGSVFNQLISNRKARRKSTVVLDMAHRLATATRTTKLNIPLNTFDIMEVTAVKT